MGRLSSAAKQKCYSPGQKFGAGYSAMRRGILLRFQEGEVLCMLGCVQRSFAFDYVVCTESARPRFPTPPCLQQAGVADWVRGLGAQRCTKRVAISRRGLLGDVQIVDSLG